MRNFLLVMLATILLSGCTIFEAGKVSKQRKELYDYNNNTEYCQKNPDRCVNNIPW